MNTGQKLGGKINERKNSDMDSNMGTVNDYDSFMLYF